MNRTLELTAVLSAALAMAPAALGAEVAAIFSHGEDGQASYYTFRCSNDVEGSVQVQTDPRQYCVQLPDGEPVCRSVWRVDDAAAHGCRIARTASSRQDLPFALPR